MAELYRPLESCAPMSADLGKWVYGKSLSPLPNADGRIPIAAPFGLATLDEDGLLSASQRPPSSGGGGFVPTYIADGDTFTVPENTQALYVLPILVDGDLVIDGNLVEI